jgi:hypothetical protein
MSFVIWYKVEIAEVGTAGVSGGLPANGLALPLTVSNDVFSGSLVLDADITVVMAEGAAADTFKVTLTNLPFATGDLVRAVQAAKAVNVSIHLGYFDEPSTRTAVGRVMVGRITSVSGYVGDDGFARTVLYGQEEAGYLLRTTKAAAGLRPTTTARAFAETLAGKAGVTVAGESTLLGDVTDFTVRAGSTLDALRSLADRADTPMVVRDGLVYFGAAVGSPADTAPIVFDPVTNIVSLESTDAEDTISPFAPPIRSTANLTVLGHPGLRVGQVARINGLSGVPAGTLRLSRVEHSFNAKEGYTARVRLIAAAAGQRAQVTGGVQGFVDRMQYAAGRQRDDHPAVDVGEVTEYAPGSGGGSGNGHRASLHYGQQPDPLVGTPSVASPVDSAVDLHGKPIASPFAFDRTGLVVPVYPRMRALLVHNRGLVNDAVVAGFVWPQDPPQRPPANEPGDYWLALPTGLDSEGLPQGPGANDLIDAAGHRVVQVAGLKILVGADALPEVGTRPDPPSDASITIEHQSGTKITVEPDGAVTITTDHQPITLTNGGVTRALDGSSVAVS